MAIAKVKSDFGKDEILRISLNRIIMGMHQNDLSF